MMRRRLVREGLLDPALKPLQEGEMVCFPVIEEVYGAERGEFEARKEPEVLPRHELIGGIAILQERNQELAERLLASRPSIHTVLVPEGAVEGEFRTKRFEVLAGVPTTRTDYVEFGLRYRIDLSVAYFSARLSGERQRVRALVEEGEMVLDMFSGVGPFAITVAEKAGVVFGCDINPDAVHLMRRNIALNRRKNVVPLFMDATRLEEVIAMKFDRVIMNLPLSRGEFLPLAFRICRPGGLIHFYVLQSKEGEYLPLIQSYTGSA
ncbi:MAG: methyltransferase, partial [Methanomicrobiaceae archaeon]|nr:methyltransferase [Methanomicrobiaceae archaeon]